MKSVFTSVVVALSATCLLAQPNQATQAPAGPRPRTAILDLSVHNPMPDDEVMEVTTRVYEELAATNRYNILDRGQVMQVLSGVAPDAASCARPECAQSLGQLLGVEKVVVGDVTKVEIIYELTLQIVDVATGKVEKTHVEKVAGHMTDVAKVGVLCAVQSLLEEKVEADWHKGDWRKVRKHGVGGRLNLVMTADDEVYESADPKSTYYDGIPTVPVLGGAVHYDAVFLMKNGMEIHYTPNFEVWVRQGTDGGTMKRVTELAFNVADLRWFFSGTYETNSVFYLGVGAGLALDLYYDPTGQAENRHPKYDVIRTDVNFAPNVMLGLEHVLKRTGWIMSAGIKVKFWEPIVFEVCYALTRPFGLTKGARDDAPVQDAPAQDAPVSPAPTDSETFSY
jgi:hypothetical protein